MAKDDYPEVDDELEDVEYEDDEYEYIDDDEDEIEDDGSDSETEDEEEPPHYVVHLYQSGEFLRTIERKFTEDMAEKFVAEYNRTAKHYDRKAYVALPDADIPPKLP